MLPNNWLRGRCRKEFLVMFVRVEGRGGRVPLKCCNDMCVYKCVCGGRERPDESC
jgi:hypothetical protein